MFLDKLSSARSDRRRTLAVALFLAVTGAAFTLLSITISHHPPSVASASAASHVAEAKEATSANNAPSILARTVTQPTQARTTQNVSPADLTQKLAADTRRLEDLQRQRRQLLAANEEAARAAPAPDFSPEHKTRQDLVQELVLLLKMSKNDQSESSEAIALRHKISRLQTELSEGDAKNPPQEQVDSRANQIALWKIRSQIALCQSDITADQQALAKSSRSDAKAIDAQTNLGGNEVTQTLGQPGTTTSPHQPMSSSTTHVLIMFGAFIASVLVGLISYVLFMKWLPREPDTISSEEALQYSLAGAANFIGSIPRMKAR